MAALKRERHIYLWHVNPRPLPKDAPVEVTLAEILAVLKASYDAEKAEIYISDDGEVLKPEAPDALKDRKNRVYVADIIDEIKTITFLINRGDPEVADPGYINSESDEVRLVTPESTESTGSSAHLVISKDKKTSYRACFERMPHIPTSYVNSLFRTLLARHAAGNAKYKYEKPVKKGKKVIVEEKTYQPLMEVKKFPSDKIKDDLENGELSGITLIHNNAKFSGLDVPNSIKSIKQRVTIRPKKIDQKAIGNLISQATAWAKAHEFNEIQIELRNLPGRTGASPRFMLDKEDAMETLYIRSQRLTDFSIALASCYGSICKEIKEKMIEAIEDEENW